MKVGLQRLFGTTILALACLASSACFETAIADEPVASNDQQAYTGEYVVLSSQIRALGAGAAIRPTGTLETGDDDGHLDQRIGASFIWYPQPLGFQTEWTVGRGPALNQAQTAVDDESLYGGYVMVTYKIDDCCGTWFPFARWNYFQGGYKSERNAPDVDISDVEFGVEWQINPAMELTLGYTLADRTNTTAVNTVGVVPYQQFDGSLFRLQFQINY